MSDQREIIRYRSSDVRCPACRKFRKQLTIMVDGILRCEGCPSVERYRRQSRARKRTAA